MSVDPLADDQRMQAAVLQHLLDIYPAPLTIAELVLALVDDPDGFRESDAVERAAGDLVRAGLLHRYGLRRRGPKFVLPTRAAARFAELPGT